MVKIYVYLYVYYTYSIRINIRINVRIFIFLNFFVQLSKLLFPNFDRVLKSIIFFYTSTFKINNDCFLSFFLICELIKVVVFRFQVILKCLI